MKIIMSLAVAVIICLILWLINSQFLTEANLITLIGKDAVQETADWSKITLSAEKLDFSSFAFGLVSLPVAAGSVYITLAFESLESISKKIFDEQTKKIFPDDKQGLINFISKERIVEHDGVKIDERRPQELNLLSIHKFSLNQSGLFLIFKDRNKIYNSIILIFFKKSESYFILVYTLITCTVYFCMPYLYIKKSIYTMHSLLFIYLSSFIIFIMVCVFYLLRIRIISYWNREVPIWFKNVSDAKLSIGQNSSKSGLNLINNAITKQNK